MVEPVDSFERGVLDCLEAAPRSTPVEQLSLVETVDDLRQSVVVAVSGASDRQLDARFGKTFGVLDQYSLAAAIGVVDEATTAHRPSVMQRLFKRI